MKKNLTVREMAEVLSVSRTTAYSLVNDEGFYPAFRIGRKVLINQEQLEKWIEEQSNRKDAV